MNIALIGWGLETRSAFKYYGDSHDYLIVSEEPRGDFPAGDNITIQHLDRARRPGLTGNVSDLSYLEGIERCDKIIYTPVARKTVEKVYSAEHAIWQRATSTTEIFFENCPTKNVIGVTGTKGKGTTSSLITEMLASTGHTVHLAGNIGLPTLDIINDIHPDDWVVLEMSNFQLYKLSHSPHIAVHLMMVAEHIDEWHLTMDNYANAKKNIFAHQSVDDIAVYLPSNRYSTGNVQASKGRKIPYTQEPGALVVDGHIQIDGKQIIATDQVGLKGLHNLDNICAAITVVWQISQDTGAMQKVVKDFTGLEHRLQIVRTHDEVTYVDDSFGTTPDTAIVAMNSFSQPKIMIVGGHDKGHDYTELASRLSKNDIKHIVIIGSLSSKLSALIKSSGVPDSHISIKENGNDWDMPEIIETATSHSRPGDVVLLSCGTSSFGIFTDYKDRGRQFIEAVNSL